MRVINEERRTANNRVLIIIPGSIEFRGIQVFFSNVLKYFWQEDFLADLYFAGFCKNKEMTERFVQYKCSVYVGELNLELRKNRKGYKADLEHLMKTHTYTCIYVNSGMPWFNMLALEEAYKMRISKRVSHSHNVHIASKNIMKRVYKRAIQIKSNFLTTNFLACSQNAGNWMFGADTMTRSGKILYNGIDASHYIFSEKVRKEYRDKYGVTDTHVILHIGAFNGAKNQSFLIDVFECVKEKEQKSKLFLIGNGQNEATIRNKVVQKGLIDDVVFIGETSEVSNYMQMADLFVLPSFYEGLGIVNIEAQAAGLKCLVSDTVPEMIDVTGLVTFLPLNDGIERWADYIIHLFRPYERTDTSKLISASGFDARITAQKLQEILVG